MKINFSAARWWNIPDLFIIISFFCVCEVHKIECFGIATGLRAGRPMFGSRHGQGSFLFATVSGTHLSNGYRGLFPRRWSGRDVKLTTHLHLAPRFGMRGCIPPLSHASSWRGILLSTGYVSMTWYLVKSRDNFTFFTFWWGFCMSLPSHVSSQEQLNLDLVLGPCTESWQEKFILIREPRIELLYSKMARPTKISHDIRYGLR
jgi:hypothetical protein